MQIDFHHAITYILARIAGFAHPDAEVVAHSAQYVDDATCAGSIRFKNHGPFHRIASAHPYDPREAERLLDVLGNLNNASNVETWSIFHFLPGNGGAVAGEGNGFTMIQRFKCMPDSPLATAMCKASIDANGRANSLHRLGITAHVYADTFAHKHFVGMKHPINLIRNISANGAHLHAVVRNAVSHLVGALPLGHGPALTCPDMPFLSWSFIASDGAEDNRDNTLNFIHACDRLVAFFGYYLGNGHAVISPHDRGVLLTGFHSIQHEEGRDRHKEWMALLGRGVFSFGALSEEELSDLAYVAKGQGSWKQKALGTTKVDDEDGPFTWAPSFETSDWKLFHEALMEHKEDVLTRIFLDFGLNVEEVSRS